jgi:hypothetical protein
VTRGFGKFGAIRLLPSDPARGFARTPTLTLYQPTLQAAMTAMFRMSFTVELVEQI